MGVFQSITLYRTDRDEVLAVSDMSSSHLLNAINHHNKQIDTISFLKDTLEFSDEAGERLEERGRDLINTISVLANELASRNIADEEVVIESDPRRNFNERY